jgi:vitamin B12/bleomycin/antimicrobial peptide transport system ATP-binding/permease protein
MERSGTNLMTLLIALSALASALGLAGGLGAGWFSGIPLYVGIAGALMTAALVMSRSIGPFLRFFIVFYAMGYVGLIAMIAAGPILPASLAGLTPPPLTAFTSAAFALLAFGMSRVAVMRQIVGITDKYFSTDERASYDLGFGKPFKFPVKWMAMGLLAIIILINLGQVWISVSLSFFNRNWFDAIQAKNGVEFWRLLFQVWVPLVAILIASNFIEFLIVSAFKIRWRSWLTGKLFGRWLEDGTHYRLQFGDARVDNPDQRISEDIRKYIETTYSLTISMIQQISSLVSFSVILWGLSSNLTLPGLDTKIPGLLFWIALAYAAIGTLVAHLIGKKLIRLNFQQEVYEADFRFGLARLREYGEPVALLGGEKAENKRLSQQFAEVIRNFFDIVRVQKWLSAFIQLYGSSNSIVPIVITAPFFFAGQITLGVLTQTSQAFARVDAALSFFIDRYSMLADFKAVVDRLSSFDTSLAKAEAVKADSKISLTHATGAHLHLSELTLTLPDRQPIVKVDNLSLQAGERTLLIGPSGSGKSTMFRAIAGIWPFGEGQIAAPDGKSVLLLPQRPYLPLGTLRAAVSYPAVSGAYSDEAIKAALIAAKLPHLAERLNEEAFWVQVLSLGEQQRVAIARVLLAKPDWLFLDEATSAMDEPMELAIYDVLRRQLPATTLVSIGHRSTLQAMHDRIIEMKPVGTSERLFSPA